MAMAAYARRGRFALRRRVVFNHGVPSDYRLSPALTARLLGVTLVVMGVLVALVTIGILVFNLHSVFLLVPAAFVVVAVSVLIVWSNSWVLRLGEDGYQVRRLRSAGTPAARWRDVEDMVSTEVEGTPCLLLRLRDGRATTLPLGALHADANELARTIAAHLNRAHGLRKL